MKVDRMLRINEMIQHLLGEIIERDLRGYLPGLVTVTGDRAFYEQDLAEMDRVYLAARLLAAVQQAYDAGVKLAHMVDLTGL